MSDFKVGDRVRVVNISNRPTGGSASAQVGMTGEITSGPSGWGRFQIADAGWAYPADLELLVDATEKMIPASKVREIARLYAERHGWCDVVDDALKEMGATDDELVEVTFTQTRVLQLRRSDLDKLHSDASLDTRSSAVTRANAHFKSDIPEGAKMVSARWTRSEPVAVTAGKPTTETEWVDCDENTYFNNGHEIRFSPSSTRCTYGGHRVPDGVTMTAIREGRSDFEGDIPVRFSQSIDGVFIRSVRANRLQRRLS